MKKNFIRCVKKEWIFIQKSLRSLDSYVKLSLDTSLIVEALCLVGLSGAQKTMTYTNSKYYWEAMNADVLEVIHSCIKCAKEKPRKGKIHYKPILPNFVFHTVSIDVVGPFQESSSGCKNLIVAVDSLSNGR